MEEGDKPLFRQLVWVALLLAALSGAGSLVSAESWHRGGVTILWPSNGLLIGVLLCTRRRLWPAYLAVGLAVDFCVNFALQNGAPISLYLACCNMLEVFLAAALTYRTIAPRPDLTRRAQLVSLAIFGMIVAPAVASFFASLSFSHWHLSFQQQFILFRTWFTADALGVATMTPLYLFYRFRAGYTVRSRGEVAALFLLLLGVTFAVFWQTKLPLLFLVLPFLLLLGVRLGLAGSALGLLLVSILGGMLTTVGRGPLALVANTSLASRDLAFQAMIAVSMVVLYVLELLTAESNRLQVDLKASEARFRLLAEASRDVIVMTDLQGRRHYVSPAVSEMLGWEPQEMLGGNYREIVHPEDVARLEKLLQECADGMKPRALPYRCLTRRGDYRWVETNPRLYRDPTTGEAAGYVNVVRDITERRIAEEELTRAFRMVENLASIDGLTGIANRRRFDETLEREWMRAQRDLTELSLLMLDVDHFKLFNDLYGHLSGDDCLRQIADSIREVVNRATDLPARYGGEEFAVILPNTGRRGAFAVCSEILASVQRRNILHAGNPHSVVTLSAGCVTRLPDEKFSSLAALQAADTALYRAKALGRNRIEVADLDARAN